MPESEFDGPPGPPTHRALSVPSELCDPATSFGSENESLGLNQRAALSELHKYGMQSSLPSYVAISCVVTLQAAYPVMLGSIGIVHTVSPAAELDVYGATAM